MSRDEQLRDATIEAQQSCRHDPMPHLFDKIFRCRLCLKLLGGWEAAMILERRKIEKEKV